MDLAAGEALTAGIVRNIRLLPRSRGIDEAAHRKDAAIAFNPQPLAPVADHAHCGRAQDIEAEALLIGGEIMRHGH
ncbi:hypothetical protein D3C87_2156930 [compost metagenome]